jgi:N-acetylglucosaminylphosphatidylinositol deacetylase
MRFGAAKLPIRKGTKVLLVVAHPDDEAMFFSPLLIAAKANHWRMSILCISTGNFDGLGFIRKQEMMSSADIYDIPRDEVNVIDNEQLQDGMANNWPAELIRDIVLECITKDQYDTVRTYVVVLSSLSAPASYSYQISLL